MFFEKVCMFFKKYICFLKKYVCFLKKYIFFEKAYIFFVRLLLVHRSQEQLWAVWLRIFLLPPKPPITVRVNSANTTYPATFSMSYTPLHANPATSSTSAQQQIVYKIPYRRAPRLAECVARAKVSCIQNSKQPT